MISLIITLPLLTACCVFPPPSNDQIDTSHTSSSTPTPLESTPVPTSDTTSDACDLQAEKSFALLENAYAQMPLPPQGAVLLRQIKSGRCETGVYKIGAVYGINGTGGYAVQEHYWNLLSDQGWKVWHRMATNPRPIFCHPHYEFITVDVVLLYDPPEEVKESYQTFFGIYVSGSPLDSKHSTWECKGLESKAGQLHLNSNSVLYAVF
jgi:hypothetical protein